MDSEGKGRLFRRKDGKYLLYIPKDLAENNIFPFKAAPAIMVNISFKVGNKETNCEKKGKTRPTISLLSHRKILFKVKTTFSSSFRCSFNLLIG